MTISDTDYKEIISAVGYPVVPEETLEFDADDIKNYMIYPALREYFIWFPIVEKQSLLVTDTFSVDFPDDPYVYSVVDVRVNSSAGSGGLTGSPFMNDLLVNKRTWSSGMYGTRYDYDITEARYAEKSYLDATNNYARARNIQVDEQNRNVSGYTTVSGELIISWAKYSENFNDIPFRRKPEVIQLAKAKVMQTFASLRNQMDSDISVSFNASDMQQKGEDMEEKILEKWKGMTKVVVVRG